MAVPGRAVASQDRSYDLAESTSPALAVGDLVDVAELRDPALGYGTSRGDSVLRDLIAADAGVGADQILVTAGSMRRGKRHPGRFLAAPAAADIRPPSASSMESSLGVDHVGTLKLHCGV